MPSARATGGASFSSRCASAWPAGAVTSDRQLSSRSASFSLQRALARISQISNLHVSRWRARAGASAPPLPNHRVTPGQAGSRLARAKAECRLGLPVAAAPGGAALHSCAGRPRPAPVQSTTSLHGPAWTPAAGLESCPKLGATFNLHTHHQAGARGRGKLKLTPHPRRS